MLKVIGIVCLAGHLITIPLLILWAIGKGPAAAADAVFVGPLFPLAIAFLALPSVVMILHLNLTRRLSEEERRRWREMIRRLGPYASFVYVLTAPSHGRGKV